MTSIASRIEDLDSAKCMLLHDVDSIRHEINLPHNYTGEARRRKLCYSYRRRYILYSDMSDENMFKITSFAVNEDAVKTFFNAPTVALSDAASSPKRRRLSVEAVVAEVRIFTFALLCP